MRELNECTAEVFRRSEKRIKERRRNRNRLLAVCIPACLIITVWLVMSSPAMMPVVDVHAYAAEVVVGNAEREPACSYITVEIQDAGMFPMEHYEKVTDMAAVAEMFHAIQSLFADTDGNGQNAGENLPTQADTANYGLSESESKWKDRTITFTTEDGSRAVYYLSGNTLVNVSTNEAIVLSDPQIAGLLTVFGLSE